MRIFLHILILGCLGVWHCNAQPGSLKIELDEISIHGTSNVNRFTLVYQNDRSGEVQSAEFSHVNIVADHYEIVIPVDRFTNPNSQLTRDFKAMVHATKYPTIKVILPISEIERVLSSESTSSLHAIVMLAGKSKRIRIPYKQEGASGKNHYLMGISNVLLTDFNIVPPVKLKGLIRVDNQVSINFRLSLKS